MDDMNKTIYRSAVRCKDESKDFKRKTYKTMELHAKNGSTRWGDAIHTKISQTLEHGTFEECGKGTTVPNSCKLIRCHFVFDVKHDGQHKARYVAGGHITQIFGYFFS
jgi:hypothetical protein